jgi:N-ethylmaleimide reductase
MKLLEPFNLKHLQLKNRMVMAPMTRSRAGSVNAPTELNAVYYAQRASAGLIISEAAQVSRQGVGYIGTPGIHTEEQVFGWKRVTKAVHDAGGRIFCQLFHGGRISHPDLQVDGHDPVAPSAVQADSKTFTAEGVVPTPPPRALATDEIPGVAEQFRHAAQCAMKAGFDGVEIHAANGYLIDQFLQDGSNKRTDRYGGSVENRARFLLEVTRAVTDACGSNRVGVHVSPVSNFNDMSDSDRSVLFVYVAEQLSRFDLAYLHVVEVDLTNSDTVTDELTARARKLRDAFNGTYIANGSFDRDRAEATLVSGDADLISFGRAFLANPDLPKRFEQGAPVNEADTSTFYGGDEAGYTDYPFMN